MKHLILVTLIGITLLGCKKENDSCGTVYFGGEIINPNSDHLVILNSDDEALDTLYLDENNRFSYAIENLNSGLHSFRHGGEIQWLILEPTDSILVRLNTLDFDGSLVFSGNGSKKNNYLINLFLKLETENKIMYNLSKKKPEEFIHILDSLKAEKYAKLSVFNKKHPMADLFNKVAEKTIDYHYYSHHEIYPFRHFNKYELKNYENLPNDFYAYRKYIDYDANDFEIFNTYYNFLFPHINNLALSHYFESTGDTIFNRSSVHYNLKKLQLIDSLIGNETIKNNMFRLVTRNYLDHNASDKNSRLVYDSFMNKNTDERSSRYIENLYNSLDKLLPGSQFPDVEVLDRKNNIINVNSLINGPTVIYFWSSADKNHFAESHNRVKELKALYPTVEFISINVNSSNLLVWKRLFRQYNFSFEHEYRFRDSDAAKKILAVSNVYKVMVINDTNEIVSTTRMFSKEFKSVLDKVTSQTPK